MASRDFLGSLQKSLVHLREEWDRTTGSLQDQTELMDQESGALAQPKSMLETLQKFLLDEQVLASQDQSLYEAIFAILRRLLQQDLSSTSTSIYTPGQLLTIAKSCLIYIPQPPIDSPTTQNNSHYADLLNAQSEELRSDIITCVYQVFAYAEQHSLTLHDAQAEKEDIDFIAYTVMSLMQIAQLDRCRPTSSMASTAVLPALKFIGDVDEAKKMLPGISTGLYRAVNAPRKTSSEIVTAVEAFAAVLEYCISDTVIGASTQQPTFTFDSLQLIAQQSMQLDTPEAEKDEDQVWIEQASAKLEPGIVSILNLPAKHSSWKIRYAFVTLCSTLLLQCRVALGNVSVRCFEELLVFRVDDIDRVSSYANDVLDKFMAGLSNDAWLHMISQLVDRVHFHLSTLQMKCSTELEVTNRHTVQILTGYCRVLGKSLQPYIDAKVELIYKSLCEVVLFDTIDTDLVVYDRKKDSKGQYVSSAQYKKRLKYFREEASSIALYTLLQSIATCCTPALFIDCAFTLLQTEAMNGRRVEALLVLNEFLKAHTDREEKELDVHLVGRILDDLLQDDTWQPSHISSDATLIHQQALQVECIGVCADLLGKDFDQFLLHVLFPLVEKLGSGNEQVEGYVLSVLETLCRVCNYPDVSALFESNMDYFVDALVSRMAHLDLYPTSPKVVEGLLRHSTVASLPLMDELSSSLLSSIDLHQYSEGHVTHLLRALHLLLKSIATYEHKEEEVDKTTTSTEEYPMLVSFLDELRALTYESDLDDGLAVIEKSEKEDDAEKSELEKAKAAMPVEHGEDALKEEDDDKPSAQQQLVLDILSRCTHFVSDNDPVTCCLVLSIITQGVHYLKDAQKHLMPLLSQMWPALMHRLQVDSRAIQTATLTLLSTCGTACPDTVADKFVKETWPHVQKMLRQVYQSDQSPKLTRSMLLLSSEADSDSERRGRKSQDMRLVLAALDCLTSVCSYAGDVASIVPKITKTCLQFLSSQFSIEVREKAQALFIAMGELNKDYVFCTAAALADWAPPSPPTTSFMALNASGVQSWYSCVQKEDRQVYKASGEVILQSVHPWSEYRGQVNVIQ